MIGPLPQTKSVAFPRFATADIPKVHESTVPSYFAFLNVDQMNQPRDIATGHFTRTDRNEIAAGMGEGDLVVIAWDGGTLKEVSRTPTDFWLLDIRSGHFTNSGLSDIYAIGTLIWGDMYPKPRVFNGREVAGANTTTAHSGPRRRLASRLAAVQTTLQIHASGDCVDPTAGDFVFVRDGVFGRAEQNQTRIDALFDTSAIYVRLSAPYTVEPAKAKLVESNGVYSGTTDVWTACGWGKMTITAKTD